MPKTKAQKQEILKGLKEKLEAMKSAVFVSFFGIKVKDINQLRKNGREEGVDYVVTKKTLLKKVLGETGYKEIGDDILKGEIAVVMGKKDEVAAAKLINDFSKTHKEMKIVAGILEGKVIDINKVMALAKLPSRQELLAKAVGSIAAPLSGLVNVLQGNLRGLVYVLNSLKEKKS